jgi:hypothetical protein
MISINTTQPLCTSCRKRVAVYRRLTSGEKLCRLCLFRSVAKQVRKTIHYYKMLKKKESVLYILRSDDIALSIEAFAIIHAAARDLEMSYNIICPSNIVNCNAVETHIKNLVKDVPINVVLTHHSLDAIPKTFIHALKYVEALAIKIALERNLGTILTPLFRDEMTLLSIYGLLTTSKTVFGEGLPIKRIGDVKVVRPFYHVISTDVMYLTITSALRAREPLHEPCLKLTIGSDRFMEKARKTLAKSPELMYSSAKSVELLQSFITAGSTLCKVCGSFSNREVCEYCETILKFL